MKNQMIQSTNRTSQLFARGLLGAFHLLPSGAGGSQGVLGYFPRLRRKGAIVMWNSRAGDV
jgi:hypothetical protein